MLTLWTSGTAVNFGNLKGGFPAAAELSRQLLERLNRIESISLAADAVNRYPGIKYSALAVAGSLDAFIAACEWFVGEMGRSQNN
jgi:hypothetical protein